MKTTTKTGSKKAKKNTAPESDGFDWMTAEQRKYWEDLTKAELAAAGK